MNTVIKQPFTALQLELLKMFSQDVNENELREIKTLLVQYFAKRAIDMADKVWEKNNWNEQTEKQFLGYIKITPKEYAEKLKEFWKTNKSNII